jgi:predicted thioredoxin/glutaredoxin
MQAVEFADENVRTGSFEPVNDLVWSVPSVCLDEEVNMVGPDRQ